MSFVITQVISHTLLFLVRMKEYDEFGSHKPLKVSMECILRDIIIIKDLQIGMDIR